MTARFVVHELALGPGGIVERFAANFTQWCGTGEPVFGEVRFNSTQPLTSTVTDPDSTPDAFLLVAPTPVRAGATVTSNPITIDGINRPVPIVIAGGEYSLNGGAFTQEPRTANPRDTIVVQMVASRMPGAIRSAMLTVGGVSAALTAFTFREGEPATGLFYRSTAGDFIGQGETRLFLQNPNRLSLARNFQNGVDASLDGVGEEWWQLGFAAPGGAALGVAAYEGATRYPLQAASEPGLSVFANGGGCNEIAGRFMVHEAVYAEDGSPTKFAADFEQRCEVTGPPLFGEIRFNSTVPFTPLTGGSCDAAASEGEPPCPPPPTMSNLSTRAPVLGGNDIVIGGFVIGGTSSKTVVVRARGPSLAAFGISNTLANPTLTLVRSSDQTRLGANDDWLSSPEAGAISLSGFAPGHSRESAIMATLEPGAYTALVSGADGGTGVGIVEVFEVSASEAPFANISTRARVLAGNDVMIGGFIIQGDGPQTVVVRARGPSLASSGVADALSDPSLRIVRSSDRATLATNDDWRAAPNVAAIVASGFAPGNDPESAILLTLEPGAYTAIITGVAGASGVGIVEIFTVR